MRRLRMNSFTDGVTGAVRFIACYLEVLKEDNPELHEKICAKQREIMKGIEPNSCRSPTVMGMINDVLQEADVERFYQVTERLNNE
jgi:hypothetical protein